MREYINIIKESMEPEQLDETGFLKSAAIGLGALAMAVGGFKMYSTNDHTVMSNASKVVASKLADPSSAEFADMFIVKDRDNNLRAVCGQVNAVNENGIKGGYRQFVLITTGTNGKDGVPSFRDIGGSITGDQYRTLRKFRNDWNYYCERYLDPVPGEDTSVDPEYSGRFSQDNR